jgi:hypothetical protein
MSSVDRVETLRFDVIDHVMLIVHADIPPSQEDWARMMLVRNGTAGRVRNSLVIAPPRATINAAQRSDVVSFTKTGSIAVVTSSALIRGIAAAVKLLGVQVRAFAPGEIAPALNYLGLAQARHGEVERRLALLQGQLAAAGKSVASRSV